MNGLEVLRRIHAKWPRVAIILMCSTHEEMRTIRIAIETMGAYFYIRKYNAALTILAPVTVRNAVLVLTMRSEFEH